MRYIVMRRPRARSLGTGLAALAVLTTGLAPAALAETEAPGYVMVRSGTTLVSDWEVYNGAWSTHPDDSTEAGCVESDQSLGVNEGTYDVGENSLGDAFDDALTFWVGNQPLVAGANWDVEYYAEGLARAVTAADLAVEGLTATVEHRAMPTQQVLRSTVWLTNPGTEPVSTPLGLYSDLGSDSDTAVVGSSSGDSDLATSDRWFVTSDQLEADPESWPDPVLTHVFAGPGQIDVAPVGTALGATDTECFWYDNLRTSYPLTVQPGATVGVMLFTEMSRTKADALSAAARFDTNPAVGDELLTGLDADELAAIVNWNFTPPPPPAPRDYTPPTSQANGPLLTDENTWTVTYDASDVGFGLRTVDLYVKAPGAATYTKAATDTSTFDGAFSYTAPSDGSYAFYTVATDHGGNIEAAPATADVTTVLDQTSPSSQAAADPLRSRTSIPVTYTVSDGTGVGVASVDLYARAPGEDRFSKVDTDGSPDGRFSYTAAGDGRYAFYTIATDLLGNTEAAPATADVTSRVDTSAPIITAKMGEAPVRFDISEHGTLALRMRVSEPAEVIYVLRRDGNTVRTLGWYEADRGLVERTWNGRDHEGTRVPDGRYTLVMKARDEAGNTSAVRMPVRVQR